MSFTCSCLRVCTQYNLGNLGYKTTVEDLANHFASCGWSSTGFGISISDLIADPPPTIRLLTNRSKASTEDKRPEKSKGCAFLEFSKASGLQTALRFHQSVLDGRKINVELSAGGGGKSDARLKKLREKNAKFQVRIFKKTMIYSYTLIPLIEGPIRIVEAQKGPRGWPW